MDEKVLVEKFGSWVRVQVAFYDFIFEQALSLCAECANQELIEGFADGKEPYEDAINKIENKFTSFECAWKAFIQSVSQDELSQGAV